MKPNSNASHLNMSLGCDMHMDDLLLAHEMDELLSGDKTLRMDPEAQNQARDVMQKRENERRDTDPLSILPVHPSCQRS